MAALFEASGARMNASGGGSILFGNTSTTNQTRNVHVQFTSTGQTNDMIPFFRQGSTNYRIPYDAAAGDHTPGTGIWFLASSEYVDWKNGEVLNMMCTGVPGAGKTVMSAAIINDLWKSHPKAVALYPTTRATFQWCSFKRALGALRHLQRFLRDPA
ncbi:hypothetical protein BDV98DRAFT_596511 [Pterulicium gracile]|uniref:Nephrocystin 3-like N-terminal domain-containing protein n=1 Tax=Pterulicium gracile TaxID=1884261 RepID=A0A5C3QGW6_9AGAR|nr:hypothetical protein BDV98DRAFT_596511 [Pterula gracilis]